MMREDEVPRDEQAEAAVLGSAMLSRSAAAEEELVSQQYERTSEGMREREEWADSNRYANYAAGHAASAHALRKRAAEYRKAVEK